MHPAWLFSNALAAASLASIPQRHLTAPLSSRPSIIIIIIINDQPTDKVSWPVYSSSFYHIRPIDVLFPQFGGKKCVGFSSKYYQTSFYVIKVNQHRILEKSKKSIFV